MTRKILGTLIILGAVAGAIFLIKWIPVYVAVNELERNFNECIGNFKQYKEKGCRDLFENTIEKNDLDLDVDEIEIDAQLMRPSTIRAEWDEPIDFFGVWTYYYHATPRHEGTPPDRD